MEENIGKPIDPSVSGGAVANPTKPTIRLIREKSTRPIWLVPGGDKNDLYAS